MKLIIAGSRNITNKGLVSYCFRQFKYYKEVTTVISGGARGVDKLGESVAADMGLWIISHPADWERHGKSAGYKRNVEMAEEADYLLAFWDRVSKGTKHMIDIAIRKNIYVEVYDQFGKKLKPHEYIKDE